MTELYGPLSGPEFALLWELAGPVAAHIATAVRIDPTGLAVAAAVGLAASEIRFDGDPDRAEEYSAAAAILAKAAALGATTFTTPTVLQEQDVTTVVLDTGDGVVEVLASPTGFLALLVTPGGSQHEVLRERLRSVPEGEPIVVRRTDAAGEAWFGVVDDKFAGRPTADSPWTVRSLPEGQTFFGAVVESAP